MIALKILVIDNIFLLGSGGENHIAEVSKYWSKSHYVQISTPKDDKLIASLSGSRGLRLYLAIFAIYVSRILKTPFISPKDSDIIIAISHYPQDVLPAIFMHLIGRRSRLVVYHHGILIPPEHGSFIRIGSIFYNYIGSLLSIHFSDLIFTINTSTLDYLLCFGAKKEKVVVTNNGVNVNQLSVSDGTKFYDACFLGRLNKSKGVFDLPKIWALVCQRRKNAKLVIMGGGSEEAEVTKLIKQFRLENNIILTSFLSENKKYEILQHSKIFIFPSYLESWGIAVAEAMACGLPVVVYSLPEYKELFGDKLITVPLGDIVGMADKVIFLLDNPKLAKEMDTVNRAFIKRYDWRLIAEMELSAIIALKGKTCGRQ